MPASGVVLVDLDAACNATAATFDADRRAGAVNAWGNSFPAEELPFGQVLEVGGTLFRLPVKGRYDHVEAVGQRLPVAAGPTVTGVALLCFGEMGQQEVSLALAGPAGPSARLVVSVPGWLAEPEAGDHADVVTAVRCTHLHYPGGYELAALRPSVLRWLHRLPAPTEVTGLDLGVNPLFHLLAVTLIRDGGLDGGDGHVA